MRILQVSAHYPPELVSGGTLQPQRIAHGLLARGHDVRVVAGSLDESRAPLDTWRAVDPGGVPVHWIATWPWVWWDDDRNHDHPEVTALVATVLDEVRPEVVHCHSLQTLGVGPVEAAADRGIPVVVTMHDFWWLCARQFLVDTDDRPCSLVVSASDCPCEAGRDHLDRRARRLARALARVDQVLVPSAVAARVLVANGVPAGLVEVDENGVPDAPAPGGARPPDRSESGPGPGPQPGQPESGPGPQPQPPTGQPQSGSQPEPVVTVRYAGGSNPLKGADVVVAALARTGPLDRVRVVAHDLGEAVRRRGLAPADLAAELAPAYPPGELEAVMAATDVLLVPSLARETYSIVTREALARGVPVIATDALGPEEVVEHDRNGLVLPAGDAGALAEALRALDAEPATVARWRAGIGPVALRPIEDQVAGLEARYAALAGRPRPSSGAGGPAGTGGRAPAVLFVVGIDGAPLRYRAQLPAEAVELAGGRAVVRHYLDPDLAEAAAGASHVVVYRAPATPRLLDLIERVRSRGTPVAFDVDDLIFDPEVAGDIAALRLLEAAEAELWMEGVRRYRTTMEACDAYLGSTATLVDHARTVVGMPAVLVPNGVGRVLGAASDRALRRPRAPGPLRVGYLSGTRTHDDDWRWVAPAVLACLDHHPDVELWLGGHLTVDGEVADRLGPRLRRVTFTAWHRLPEVLRDLDVNLAPLRPGSAFNDAKSAIKWLEAALCETPTVATPTEPFRAAVENGRTGLLAEDAPAWEAALDRLLGDAGLRARMGRQAKREALLELGPARQARRYLDALDVVAEAHRAGRAPSSWVPVIRDEGPLPHPVALDPYPVAVDEARTWTTSRAVRAAADRQAGLASAAGRLGASLRHDGLAATGRRLARAARRRLGPKA